MEKQTFDCIVIGGGPGGYVAAIRLAQKGAKTALIEAKELGGTCLNRGCIPSKSLIADADLYRKIKHSTQHGITVGDVTIDFEKMKLRKDKIVERLRAGVLSLVNANKITLFQGKGKFFSPNEVKIGETVIEAKNIIIATGSEPRIMSQFPVDGKLVHDSTSFLNISKLPKSLIVIGGGIIGSEFASLYRELGVEVTILEVLPHIVAPEGKNISETLTTFFKRRGIKVETNIRIKELQKNETSVKVICEEEKTFEADIVLVCVGRSYNTENIGLEKTGIALDKNGAIAVNDKMQTNVPHIYAIGDITAKWLLAHVASHQGIVAADNILGHTAKMSYKAVPSVIFTTPEIATVGLTLEKALEAGFDAVIGKYPFQALGKAQVGLETDGFAQVVISKSTKQILGAQVVGHEASTLITEMVIAIQNELTLESIAETIHAHPTLPEVWLEAILLANDEPIHFPPQTKAPSK